MGYVNWSQVSHDRTKLFHSRAGNWNCWFPGDAIQRELLVTGRQSNVITPRRRGFKYNERNIKMGIKTIEIRKKITLPVLGELTFGLYSRHSNINTKRGEWSDGMDNIINRSLDVYFHQKKITKLK